MDDEDEGFNIDPGFTIDADGNLVEERTPGPGTAPHGGMRFGSDSAASAHVRRELMEGQEAGRFEVSPGLSLESLGDSCGDSLVPWILSSSFHELTMTLSCLTLRLFQR